jgi:hypothetical protein
LFLSINLSVKPWFDEEAKVIAHEEGSGRNQGRMGALTLSTPDGRQFSCGTGFNDAQRNKPPKIGSIVTYKYTELINFVFPRFPVFVYDLFDFVWNTYCQRYQPPAKKTTPKLKKNPTITEFGEIIDEELSGEEAAGE